MQQITNEQNSFETFKGYLTRANVLEETVSLFKNFAQLDSDMFNFIIDNYLNEDNNIFTCKYSEILKIKKFLDKNTAYKKLRSEYRALSKKEKDNSTGILHAFHEIMQFFESRYDNYEQSKMLYDVFHDLDIRACPYCNLNSIDTVITDDDRNKSKKKKKISSENKITRATCDHFLPKSEYPFFSISYYNLIPSCSDCNSSLKKDNIELTPVNPFHENFDTLAHFEVFYKTQKLKTAEIDNEDNLDILIINDTNKDYINEHCELFKLYNRYKTKKYHVASLLTKIDFFQKETNDIINRLDIPKYSNQDSIKKMLFDYFLEENSINRYPLMKLTRDLLKQFDNKV